MTPETWAASIALVATALGLREWGPGLVQQITGRAGRERERIQAEAARVKAEREQEIAALRAERDAAEREADVQACRRRVLQEYVSLLRVQLYGAGITPPDYPDLSPCRGNPFPPSGMPGA